MPCGASPRLGRLLRGILKTLSSCSLRTRSSRKSANLHEAVEPTNPAGSLLQLENPVILLHQVPAVELEVFSFSPSPIDTSNMVLPDCVTVLRDRLAENLHELWAFNKIEAGWCFGEHRDDTAKKHPCLTTYDKLTDTEKNYDITLTMETLKTLLTLGYEICKLTPREPMEPKLMDVPDSFTQSNGYKPVPYDLSSIQLNPEVEDLVEALAANLHEIWAKNRIKEGWRYGNSEDNSCKRSPNLVPYDKIDYTIKKANRDAVLTIVKSLLACGSDLRAPVDAPNRRKFVNQRLQSTISNTSGSSTGEDNLLRP